MALSTDVRLPQKIEPTWPDRCVRCGASSPSATAKLTDRRTTWWTTILMKFAPKIVVRAPACPACVKPIERRQLVEKVVMIASVTAGVLIGLRVVSPLVPSWPRGWVAMGAALVAYVPAIAWRIFRPPPFGIQAWDDFVDYEFADEAYAQEFAALNDGELR